MQVPFITDTCITGLFRLQAALLAARAELLKVWLALTRIKYHDNL